MLVRLVKFDRFVEVCPRLDNFAGVQVGRAHEAMARHQRQRRLPFLGQSEELRR